MFCVNHPSSISCCCMLSGVARGMFGRSVGEAEARVFNKIAQIGRSRKEYEDHSLYILRLVSLF